MAPDPWFQPVVVARHRSVLLVDFDGTLAPIVEDPASAAPAPGAVEALAAIGRAGCRVAVVSGRPVAFLARHLPDDIDCSGLYGLEQRIAGVFTDAPEAAPWRPVISAVVGAAHERFPGAVVEDKGLSVTLHHRRHPDLADDIAAFASGAANEHGAVVRTAKASVEIHPDLPHDKGTVVREWATGCDVAVYAGDDVGDRPAFDAIRAVAGRGIGVLVASDETEPSLRAAATVVVDGPHEFVADLRRLAAALAD